MSDLQTVVNRLRWSVQGKPQPRAKPSVVKCSVCAAEHTPGTCPKCGYIPLTQEQKSELRKAGKPELTAIQRLVMSMRGKSDVEKSGAVDWQGVLIVCRYCGSSFMPSQTHCPHCGLEVRK